MGLYTLVILLLCFVYNARSQDSNYCSISPSHTLCQYTVRIVRVCNHSTTIYFMYKFKKSLNAILASHRELLKMILEYM